MNVLDENITADQRELLRQWKIRTLQIGQDVGRQGMKDEHEIIPLLLQVSRPCFFTRDLGFFQDRFCHSDYCIACLAVRADDAATFIRRALRHQAFNTHVKRMGKVVVFQPTGIRVFKRHGAAEMRLEW
ncbi:MAG TPA: hypothetical protein VF306_10630 [Pirellulales bacterium]